MNAAAQTTPQAASQAAGQPANQPAGLSKPGNGAAATGQKPAGGAAAPATATRSAPANGAPGPVSRTQPTAPAGPRNVRITFRRSQSLESDRKRLSDLLDMLAKYEGEDRFVIIIEANATARYQLDFPNNHTRWCRELQVELTQKYGAGAWQIE